MCWSKSLFLKDHNGNEMRQLFVALLGAFFFNYPAYQSFAQDVNANAGGMTDPWPDLQECVLPAQFAGISLPTQVDNSTTPYFRPIFSQIGASCGQASTIGYGFTYEMCRARNLPASDSNNQFPSHFIYNFLCYDGYYGVNYLHSIEIAKTIGTVDLATYGGMAIDDGLVWLSGYDYYYNAMKNRVGSIKMIRTGTPAGLENLKHWLAHHHEGAAVGGVANFASGTPYNMVTIPPGLPEGGKKLITLFPGQVATHAMTIVGYNDSIRYDVNNDGQFTNHLDITGDGLVDMRDWEIGALKIANSYGAEWGNAGFYFALYRTLALNEYHGGIWGNMVHVMEVNDDYEPQMAVKVTLKHNLREQVKITAGVSSNPNAARPDHVMHFPIFNYQGGKHFMQGGTSNPANQTIEFGLDITPLLSFLEPGASGAFFLEVHENDPFSSGTGEVVAFSLMDYSNGSLVEVGCNEQNVPLVNNGITRLKVNHTPVFEPVNITTSQIPLFDASYTLQAEGGKAPYNWELLTPYHQQMIDQPFPNFEGEVLTPEGPYEKFATKALGFTFPFYGERFDTVYVHTGGFILFEPDIYPWRYLRDSYHLFRDMKNISAFLFAPVLFYEGTKDQQGIFYEGDETHATFRWNTNLTYYDNNVGTGEFALTLYPDGNIDFYYNDILVDENILWYAGVSAGGGTQHTFLKGANDRDFFQQRAFRLVPEIVPPEMSLSSDGVFMAWPGTIEAIPNLHIRCTDDRGLFDETILQFSNDLRLQCSFHAEAFSPPFNGALVQANFSLSNIAQESVTNIEMLLQTNDAYAVVTDSLLTLSEILPGQTQAISNVFGIQIAGNCPDSHTIMGKISITSSVGTRSVLVPIFVRSGELRLDSYLVDDNDNQMLDPGETTPIVFNVSNQGSIGATDILITLSSSDPFVSVLPEGPQLLGGLIPGASLATSWTITVDDDCPIDHQATFSFHMASSQGFESDEQLKLTIGQYPVLIVLKSTDSTSALAMEDALTALGVDHNMTAVIDGNAMKYRALMICGGTYGNTINLTAAELDAVETYLIEGGNMYRESFYSWSGSGIIPSYFGVVQENMPNPQTISSLEGLPGTPFEDVEAAFTGAVNYMFFKISPAAVSSAPLMRADIANDAWSMIGNQAANYNTIASLYEFGYFGETGQSNERIDLMKSVLAFFNMEHLIVNDTETITVTDKDDFISVFPNPFHAPLQISLNNDSFHPIILCLMTADGREIVRSEIHGLKDSRLMWPSAQVVSSLKPGVYFLKAIQDEKMRVIPLIRQ